eukprot:m.168336 g.168336  ORF g.168336 m.168336 type:complete len:462 (-) comp53197_c0_seq2:250-1635(-)
MSARADAEGSYTPQARGLSARLPRTIGSVDSQGEHNNNTSCGYGKGVPAVLVSPAHSPLRNSGLQVGQRASDPDLPTDPQVPMPHPPPGSPRGSPRRTSRHSSAIGAGPAGKPTPPGRHPILVLGDLESPFTSLVAPSQRHSEPLVRTIDSPTEPSPLSRSYSEEADLDLHRTVVLRPAKPRIVASEDSGVGAASQVAPSSRRSSSDGDPVSSLSSPSGLSRMSPAIDLQPHPAPRVQLHNASRTRQETASPVLIWEQQPVALIDASLLRASERAVHSPLHQHNPLKPRRRSSLLPPDRAAAERGLTLSELSTAARAHLEQQAFHAQLEANKAAYKKSRAPRRRTLTPLENAVLYSADCDVTGDLGADALDSEGRISGFQPLPDVQAFSNPSSPMSRRRSRADAPLASHPLARPDSAEEPDERPDIARSGSPFSRVRVLAPITGSDSRTRSPVLPDLSSSP